MRTNDDARSRVGASTNVLNQRHKLCGSLLTHSSNKRHRKPFIARRTSLRPLPLYAARWSRLTQLLLWQGTPGQVTTDRSASAGCSTCSAAGLMIVTL